jgi:hypothetical protein
VELQGEQRRVGYLDAYGGCCFDDLPTGVYTVVLRGADMEGYVLTMESDGEKQVQVAADATAQVGFGLTYQLIPTQDPEEAIDQLP